MKTHSEFIPIPNSFALTTIKEHRLMIIKDTGKMIFRITWKALLYAFILTIANVII